MTPTKEQVAIHEALIDPHSEAHERLERSLYPEAFPSGCTYPPHAVSMLPEYHKLNSDYIEVQIQKEKWNDALRLLMWSRDRLIAATEPEALPKLDDDQQALLLAAAKALGAFISRAYKSKSDKQEVMDRISAEQEEIERKWNVAHPVPEADRWMKHAADQIAEALK